MWSLSIRLLIVLLCIGTSLDKVSVCWYPNNFCTFATFVDSAYDGKIDQCTFFRYTVRAYKTLV